MGICQHDTEVQSADRHGGGRFTVAQCNRNVQRLVLALDSRGRIAGLKVQPTETTEGLFHLRASA